MSGSPSTDSSEVLNISVIANGTDKTESVSVLRINVAKTVNRIATATICFLDGDMPEQTFPVSDDDDFAPGNTIDISAGYGADTQLIFSGMIIKHGVSICSANTAELVLECKDEAIKMTIGRKNVNYIKQTSGASAITDKTVFSTILDQYSLDATIGDTSPEFSGLVQYNSTDWDFLVSRAEANAMLVLVSDGTITVDKPDLTQSPVLSVSYGKDIIEFKADLDARFQFSKVTSVGWDIAEQKVIEEVVSATADTSDRGTKNGDLSSVIGLDDFRLQSQTPLVKQSLTEWAESQLLKSHLSLLRGTTKFQGSALVKLGDMLELSGVGSRFSGNVFISAFEHELNDGNWTTEVEFGLTNHWFSEQTDLSTPDASGLLPPAKGLQLGIVTKLEEDPDSQYRVQVTIPLLQADDAGIWARMAHYYASSGFGCFFIPEVGDEVVVGYFNNNPSCPVILGSLYSQKNTAPLELTKENYIKSLTTKSLLKMQFDDEKKVITFETPGGHSIVMDDDQKNIVITDLNKNKMEMNESGIAMTSPGDVTIKADGKISLTAGSNIEASATADVKVDGLNITNSATTAYKSSGSVTAEVSASGTTTIKGAMVMIN